MAAACAFATVYATGDSRAQDQRQGVAAAPGAAPAASPEVRDAAFKLFGRDGRVLGSLRIGRVTTESRREGFLRVAFRPLTVLDEVSIEITDETAWPEAGEKIIAALRPLIRAETELRQLRLHIAGATPQRVHARAARLRADGALELRDAVAESAEGAMAPLAAGVHAFWLTGPRAGQLLAEPAQRPRAARAPAPEVASHSSPLRSD